MEMIFYCIILHFTVSISLELRYRHFTSQCLHCEHDSDNRGSKYIVQCNGQRRTHLSYPVVQAMTRSDRVGSNLKRHLPIRSRATNVISYNQHSGLHSFGRPPTKGKEGIRPSARGHLFSVSLEDHMYSTVSVPLG